MSNVSPENLLQVIDLVRKFERSTPVIPFHACTKDCPGTSCVQPLLLGLINPPKWNGGDVLFGFGSTGYLIADYDHRRKVITRFWASFPMPPWMPNATEDYTEALKVRSE